ncbi:GDSL-type esterase/lipase family protein [Streptomyces sp. CA-111067]|uniref:GDSL-type esterase/lipase family protein n=1 Tax=Streptomyces sp. CA-111067 TaxID=3240046 RepID=UPI003D96DF1C
MALTRSFLIAGAATCAMLAAGAGAGVGVGGSAAASGPHAVGTWAASPIQGATSSTCPAGPGGLTDQTVRDIVFAAVGGDRVRVRLSNVFGTAPLTVASASVAVEGSGADTVPGTMRALRFGGARSVTIPPGAEVSSDWVGLKVRQLQNLAVSAYVPHLDGPATFHTEAHQTNFLSGTGDFATEPGAAAFPTTMSCWMFADGVDVVPSTSRLAGSVVAFGDSITDGSGSTSGTNHRWPNYLAGRLDALPGRTLSVVDEGIGGNRVLSDAGTSGVSALSRFDRDVLAQPGARDVILLEGINDIGQSDIGTTPKVTAADLIAGYQQLIDRAHAAGLRMFGATLTPFKGAGYWSAEGEATRDAVNRWILGSGAFDGTIDFAAATASPEDPQVYDPAYDSGDHLHPNEAGYQAMARTVDTSMLVNPLNQPEPVRQTLGAQSVGLSAPHIVAPGAGTRATTTYTNNGDLPVEHVQVGLTAPAGWTARATSRSSFAVVPPHTSVRTTWSVGVPAGTAPGHFVTSAVASYRCASGTGTAAAPSDMSVPFPSLASIMNNQGVTDDADPSAGAFVDSGKTYSAQALAAVGVRPGPVTYAGTSFTWPAAGNGQPDNVEANGQVVAFSGSGDSLAFLGAAASGTHGGTGTVYYTDGSSQPYSLSFSDWWTPAATDQVVATAGYINAPTGRFDHTADLYYAAVPLQAGKTVQAVALPATGTSPSPGLHIFAMATTQSAPDQTPDAAHGRTS